MKRSIHKFFHKLINDPNTHAQPLFELYDTNIKRRVSVLPADAMLELGSGLSQCMERVYYRGIKMSSLFTSVSQLSLHGAPLQSTAANTQPENLQIMCGYDPRTDHFMFILYRKHQTDPDKRCMVCLESLVEDTNKLQYIPIRVAGPIKNCFHDMHKHCYDALIKKNAWICQCCNASTASVAFHMEAIGTLSSKILIKDKTFRWQDEHVDFLSTPLPPDQIYSALLQKQPWILPVNNRPYYAVV